MSQKKKSSLSFGPGASSLILIFVVLALSVLGMLSLMNSRNDVRLSERSMQVTEAVYALNVRAEEKKAELTALCAEKGTDEETLRSALPEGVTLEENRFSWTESDDFRQLDCALEILPGGGEETLRWVRFSLTAKTEGD